jgi:hypothetical protein
MPEPLMAFVKYPYSIHPQTTVINESNNDLTCILALLIDQKTRFTFYKSNTVVSRIERLSNTNIDSRI